MASQKESFMEAEHTERTTMSPEEIGKHRATAQQSSIDAIRAAEERYEKAKQSGASALQETKEAIIHSNILDSRGLLCSDIGSGTGTLNGSVVALLAILRNIVLRRGSLLSSVLGSNAGHVHRGVLRLGTLGSPAAVKAKDVTVSAGETAADYAKQAAEKARDATMSTGKTAADYAQEAAAKAKDVTVETGKRVADYAQRAGVKAKDVTVETGKSFADHAKQAAAKTKDATVSTGKSAADYAREKAVGAKDATAGAGQKAMEYVGQKAGEAKEAAEGTGQKTKGSAEQKAEEARETAKESNQPAEEYAEQKSDEAKVLKNDSLLPINCTAYLMKLDVSEFFLCSKSSGTRPRRHGRNFRISHSVERKRQMMIEATKNLRSRGNKGRWSMSTEERPKEAPVQQTELVVEGKSAGTTSVGDLFEAVGAVVIEAAQSAKELVMGRQPEERKE